MLKIAPFSHLLFLFSGPKSARIYNDTVKNLGIETDQKVRCHISKLEKGVDLIKFIIQIRSRY